MIYFKSFINNIFRLESNIIYPLWNIKSKMSKADPLEDNIIFLNLN